MNVLRAIGMEILGLFVEDWIFALAIAIWLGVIAAAVAFGIGPPAGRGPALFLGLAAILTASVARAAGQYRK